MGLRQLALSVESLEETVEGLENMEIMANWNGKRYVIIKDPDRNTVQLCE